MLSNDDSLCSAIPVDVIERRTPRPSVGNPIGAEALQVKCAFYDESAWRGHGNIGENHGRRDRRRVLKIGQCRLACRGGARASARGRRGSRGVLLACSKAEGLMQSRAFPLHVVPERCRRLVVVQLTIFRHDPADASRE